MQMQYPLPLNSPLDPTNTNPDYDYKNPLNADGSNYPCKNYQNAAVYPQTYTTKATWTAGQAYSMNISSSGANHDGGSCQLSLSYDNGASFKVIKSMIGGCPVTLAYDFTVPSFAPASDSVLFSWSWFNLVGNREMYMDCARVQIESPIPGRHRRASLRRQAATNASSMDELPDLFTCNIDNGCTSIEYEDVQFPNPGSDVVHGQDLAQTQPGNGYVLNSGSNQSNTATYTSTFTSTAPYTNATSTISTLSLPSSVTTSSATMPTAGTSLITTAASTDNATTSTTALTASTPSFATSSQLQSTSVGGSTSSTASPSSAAPSFTPPTGSCTVGSFACNSASTFSQCGAAGTYIFMGSVAAGMQCSNGQIIRQNSGSCPTDGAIVCNGANAFYICDHGGLISMGPVAPGTTCVDGAIQ